MQYYGDEITVIELHTIPADEQKLFCYFFSMYASYVCSDIYLTPPGRDTNPSQVSSQQTLVLIYLPQKDGKMS